MKTVCHECATPFEYDEDILVWQIERELKENKQGNDDYSQGFANGITRAVEIVKVHFGSSNDDELPVIRLPLTKRQADVLKSLVEMIAENGYPPTVRELSERVGLKAPSVTFFHLKALGKKGYIQHEATKPRALKVLVTRQ